MDRRSFTCDSIVRHRRSPGGPLTNFKIEVVNNLAKKEKKDHALHEYNRETPAKKSFTGSTLSPDAGCFIDYSNNPSGYEPPSDPTQPHSEHSSQPRGNEGRVPFSVLSLSFDRDVDETSSFHPLGSCNEENCENVDEDQGFYSMSYLKECRRDSAPTPTCPVHLKGVIQNQDRRRSVKDCSAVASDSGAPVQPLEGDIEELWNIGAPLHESSVCHDVRSTHNADSESLVVITDTSVDTSHETPLPLRVQVRGADVHFWWYSLFEDAQTSCFER